jgi:hypothetical protein
VYRTISGVLDFADSWASFLARRVLEQTEFLDEDSQSDWDSDSAHSESHEEVKSPKDTQMPSGNVNHPRIGTRNHKKNKGSDHTHLTKKYSRRTVIPENRSDPRRGYHLPRPRSLTKNYMTMPPWRYQLTLTSHKLTAT